MREVPTGEAAARVPPHDLEAEKAVIGAMLVSETTVKTHVARILMKLHLRDRVQAVVYAYETGMVQPGAT